MGRGNSAAVLVTSNYSLTKTDEETFQNKEI